MVSILSNVNVKPLPSLSEMKIRSISDVITNSSTEVWIIKSDLFERSKYNLGDLIREERFYDEGSELLWEKFKIFKTIEDLKEDWRSRYLLPREIFNLLSPYRLPEHDRSLLINWGHSEEEIMVYEQKKTGEREKLLEKIDLSKYLGKAVAVFGDHISRWGNSEPGQKLIKYLKSVDPKRDGWSYDF